MAHQPDVVVTFVADASAGRRWGYGQTVRVGTRDAQHLAASGNAVIVHFRSFDNAHAQRRLLVHLRNLERAVITEAAKQPTRRLRRPGHEWAIPAVQALEERPAATPVYTDALAALARRGLVVRLDRTRAVLATRAAHTQRAQLSDAGRWVARALEQDPRTPSAELEAVVTAQAPAETS